VCKKQKSLNPEAVMQVSEAPFDSGERPRSVRVSIGVHLKTPTPTPSTYVKERFL